MMAIYNEEERKAGTLLLSQFKMFNEATVMFETHIEPSFWKGFDRCIDEFVRAVEWAHEINYADNEYSWLAPQSWEVENDSWRYWFETYNTAMQEADFTLALLTGNGTEDAEMGFRFTLAERYFGKGKKRAVYVSERIGSQYYSTLGTLGFRDLNDGNFFLPVHLDLNIIAACWQEHGEFPHDHAVFSPLCAALRILKEAALVFEAFCNAPPDELEN
ncbi:MAG: hypothetical protein E6470_19400 [Enterobacteriaceae bacterium]|jgi:hypothetical protein|nr:hypothetical protein [Kluyvera intermedia]MDU6685773.1 hypothetical protein [Enterobacteriaceae bacterium]